jgi:hypothetical protein
MFKNHFLEIGLIQNRKTMALWTLTTIDFIYFIIVWGLTWMEIHWNSIWLRAGHIWLHTTLEGPWPRYIILVACWEGLWTLSFGLSQFYGHNSWLCEVALSYQPTLTYLSSHMWVTYHTRSHNMTCKVTPFDIYPHPTKEPSSQEASRL